MSKEKADFGDMLALESAMIGIEQSLLKASSFSLGISKALDPLRDMVESNPEGALKVSTAIYARFDSLLDTLASTEKFLKAQREPFERIIFNHMQAEEIDVIKNSDGTFKLEDMSSYKLPDNGDDRIKFMNWLKRHGLYKDNVTISIHHATLNKLLKELEAEHLKKVQASGKGSADFRVPGIARPKPFYKLKFKQNKQKVIEDNGNNS